MRPDPSGHFPASYRAARTAFREAARARNLSLDGHALRRRDLDGDELTIDTAYLGPEQPHAILVMSSGVHGVEGFAGSAIQHRVLCGEDIADALPARAGLLLVHVLNPHGFANLRRVNESNVDLNRNFVSHPDGHEPNPGYETLRQAINPTVLDPETDAASMEALRRFARRNGNDLLQQALTRGQYRHADGVQFGGTRPEESARALEEIARRESRGAAHVLWIDLHTGLGPSGQLELISEYAPGDAAFERSRSWFGEQARSTLAGDSVSVALSGVIERGLERALADRALTPLTAEFGTHDSGRVFWAMRADNWLHHHGEPDSALGRRIQDELVEAFCPADPAWRRRVLDGGAELFRAAARAIQRT